jgi:hypothetical protein
MTKPLPHNLTRHDMDGIIKQHVQTIRELKDENAKLEAIIKNIRSCLKSCPDVPLDIKEICGALAGED